MNNVSVCIQQYNPQKGETEWSVKNDFYDYYSELARSAFADMLHDKERNEKYFLALRKSIHKLKKQGKKVHVLDIGTGTGILAMMAVKCGADKVTACESFIPIANCAEKIIKENGYSDKIKLLKKRSTDVIINENSEMKEKANLLVTEIFDTELIGEGALQTFRHALQHLLEPNSILIPSSAVIYIQLVNSEKLFKWNKVNTFEINGIKLIIPKEIEKCAGAPAVHDIQISQLPEDMFSLISEPINVLRFQFDKFDSLQLEYSNKVNVKISNKSICHALFMWWDLHLLNDERDLVLSCSPYWIHPKGKSQPWRDHWMQGVYYLSDPVDVNIDEELNLLVNHDEYSLWFQIFKSEQLCVKHRTFKLLCTCGMHMLLSRIRLSLLSDSSYYQPFMNVFKKYIKKDTICLVLGDLSMLSIPIAKLGAEQVYTLETKNLSISILEKIFKINSVDDRINIISKKVDDINITDFNNKKINFLVGEPFYTSAFLPWHNLYFYHQRSILNPLLHENCVIIPSKATLWGIAVYFKHLWKIRSPVNKIDDFNLKYFDQIIQEAINVSDPCVESHPLWEYETFALSSPFEIMNFDFLQCFPEQGLFSEGYTELFRLTDYTCNGIALWMNWSLPEIINTGPTEEIELGGKITWNMNYKQGVYFFVTNNSSKVYFEKKLVEFKASLPSDFSELQLKFNLLNEIS